MSTTELDRLNTKLGLLADEVSDVTRLLGNVKNRLEQLEAQMQARIDAETPPPTHTPRPQQAVHQRPKKA